jgi:hypothetical protein
MAVVIDAVVIDADIETSGPSRYFTSMRSKETNKLAFDMTPRLAKGGVIVCSLINGCSNGHGGLLFGETARNGLLIYGNGSAK